MIAAVINHLWQSTLFAGAIALLAVLFRNNRASVRHALWMAASVKFLLPFAVLIALGRQVEWPKEAVTNTPQSEAIEYVGEPLTVLASPARSLSPEPSNPLASALLGVWLIGFIANSMAYGRRWWHARAALSGASTIPLNVVIPALSISTQLEPGVYGIVRPVLLLPDGLMDYLSPSQFDAVVAHEMCHVRRRDNLTYAIHMIAETMFWFYPPVRWIGTRLIEERERACDEAVLRMGSDPEEYAMGIVTVCRLYLKSPAAWVSGATGSDLRRRVETIMLNRLADGISVGKKMLLVVTAAAVVAVPLLIGIVDIPQSSAQQMPKPIPQQIVTSALPEFAVATIKPSPASSNLGVNFAAGGKLYITNATLRFLIKIAYDIGDDQLAGGPGWLSSRRFDVAAIPDIPVGGDPVDMAPDQIVLFHKPTRLRLQRLLAERFQLGLRKESTNMPVFALMVANGGPVHLPATKSSGDVQINAKAGSGDLRATAMDMGTLAKFLSEGQTGRPVVDMTGLKGKYDFRLEWAPDTNQAPLPPGSAPGPQSTDASGITIFTALQQQLGLKLVPRTSPADRLVVSRAEVPSAN